MASKKNGVDRVQEIADDIAALPPTEKKRLIRLLVEAGHLPAPNAPLPSQLSLDAPPPSGSPDYVLTFDGGSKGNPGWGYGSYVITRVQDGVQIVRTKHMEFYGNVGEALIERLQLISEGSGAWPITVKRHLHGFPE